MHLNDIISDDFPGNAPIAYERALRDEFDQLYVADRDSAARNALSGPSSMLLKGRRYTDTAAGGRHVNFIALDILKTNDRKIARDWHLENHTTLDRQIGKRNG